MTSSVFRWPLRINKAVKDRLCDTFATRLVGRRPSFVSRVRLSRTYVAPQKTISSIYDSPNKTSNDIAVDSSSTWQESETVALRPYQMDAIQACLTALQRGKRRVGVSSPTGSGKTTMFMHLIPQVQACYPTLSVGEREMSWENPKGGTQTLILVGNIELASQAEEAARRILKHLTIEVEQARRVASGLADVTIATYQTLNNPERLKKFDPALFKLVIVDEAHHAAALSYLRLLHYFNDDVIIPASTGPISSFNHGNKVPIIGFSATFSRHDQLALRAAFEEIVFHRDVGDMFEGGWLSPVRSTSVHCDLDLDSVERKQNGDYKASSLTSRINLPEINDLIVRTYLHRAGNRRSTLIFAVDLHHVSDLVAAFRSAGIDARSVSSKTAAHCRKDIIESFKLGSFPVLVNCEVLTEGTDIREIDCIILARPTRSKNLLAQMVGRGLRLSPESGKENCYLIDIVDNISRSSGMAVSPTLFGLSHDEGENKPRTLPDDYHPGTDAENSKDEPISRRHQVDFKVTLVDSEDPFGIRSPMVPVMSRISQNAWVACGNDKYILELLGSGFIAVARSGDPPWSITYTQRISPELGPSPYRRKQQIAYGESFERAIETADKYAERRAGPERLKQLSRYAPWRQRIPSEKQLKMFLGMKGIVPGRQRVQEVTILGKTVPIDKLTAGQVASYLCAVQHDAMSARAKVNRATARREARELAKKNKDRDLSDRNLPLPTILSA